ncbi:MAG: carboxypeptidase-like regulatory domain-containing protein [Terriglobia bacterium]
MLFRKNALVLLTVGVLLIWCAPVRGQTVYGSITGTILDATGAAIPGATVTLVAR